MNVRSRPNWSLRIIIWAALLVLVPSSLVEAQPAGAKSHALRGKVVSVNPSAGTLNVANENVEGWMAPMTMTYKADRAEALKTLKAGDTITATVYDGDFTTLYDLKLGTASAGSDLPEIVYACPTSTEASYASDKP